MGGAKEREETTEYATRKINGFLKKREPDYVSALLISDLYANIRLRTLLTDWISPQESNKWKRISSEVINRLRFPDLVKLCDRYGLLDLNNNITKKLRKLHTKRNEVAHNTRLWRGVKDSSEKKAIKNLCNFAIKFLKRTNS